MALLLVSIYAGLPGSLIPNRPVLAQNSPSTASGSRVVVNGQTINVPWQIQGERVGIADYGVEQNLGMTLLSNSDSLVQPVQWFSDPRQNPLQLSTWWEGGYRFLDITPIAQQQGWQIQPFGTALQLQVGSSEVESIRLGRQTWGDRIVVDLSGVTTWSLTEAPEEFTVLVNASSLGGDIAVEAAGLAPDVPSLPGNLLQSLTVTPGLQQIILRGTVAAGARPVVSTLPEPNRLVIDIRQDALVPRDILWAPGLRWRQQYVATGSRAFPVYWLEIEPQQTALNLRPIWSDPTTATGITPLTTMAQRWQSAAAINGGFFNRNNQYPLGAIRRDRNWISGPILGRGAIAWDDNGRFLLNRLALNQALITDQGRQFPIQAINSGYVQAGIGLYTPAWGTTYTPITDGETVVTLTGNQVIRQQVAGAAGTQPIPIPADGYLLAVRSLTAAAVALVPGSQVQLVTQSLPEDFESFPQVMAAGPLLLKQNQVVLNADAEGFSTAFATQAAPRSAVGLDAKGHLLLAAIHFSPGGRGPTLSETAEIMRRLGSVDALNLDGGSSSSLYLGGRLINRDPRTAGRVHNGIGVFINP